MSLLQLPDETLQQIVFSAKAKDPDLRTLRSLALANKRISRVCDAGLWKCYDLVIRGSGMYQPSRDSTRAERLISLEKRAAHLLSKANVVNDLRVSDDPHESEAPYAPFVMKIFMPAISACKNVGDFCLRTSSNADAQWPDGLWQLITTDFSSLVSLDIGVNFVNIPRPDVLEFNQVWWLKLRWCRGLVDELLALDVGRSILQSERAHEPRTAGHISS